MRNIQYSIALEGQNIHYRDTAGFYIVAFKFYNISNVVQNKLYLVYRYIESGSNIVFRPHQAQDSHKIVYYYIPGGSTCSSEFPYIYNYEIDVKLNSEPFCTSFGSLLHETFHALGFLHEHQRQDRDYYITNHIYKYYSNCDIIKGKILSAYDYASIMHYPTAEDVFFDPFFKHKEDYLFNQRTFLTSCDWLGLNRVYIGKHFSINCVPHRFPKVIEQDYNFDVTNLVLCEFQNLKYQNQSICISSDTDEIPRTPHAFSSERNLFTQSSVVIKKGLQHIFELKNGERYRIIQENFLKKTCFSNSTTIKTDSFVKCLCVHMLNYNLTMKLINYCQLAYLKYEEPFKLITEQIAESNYRLEFSNSSIRSYILTVSYQCYILIVSFIFLSCILLFDI